ncbi:ABC transporter ATP-binding protein [Sphaerobacter thermophilus]|uniref:ABC transporter related protein n=1 Tax=Sphaerobacter thermophilus (strain ATCC 49802 / DSM 20745 / KCCM 41009 / NCIMB 13125 / S 6022) TaxID=479434 RepID=D1C1L3_SPHTD|nr:ABC transporter ATP-binding protein [Sphaerobacter thermophilus]ACZ38130.1 ABC transporter related protein [Sphaerobacter thermophilus DSM 20745]PZN67222.1 MAG: ABC transporter ATP-binding protein [Sphaerobacter thermophilus]
MSVTVQSPATRRPTASVPAVTVEHLSKVFVRYSLVRRRPLQTVHALDDVSFDVHRKEIFGILGVNGSGKSTLIRVLSTLLIPDAGTVRIFGLDLRKDEAQIKRLINRVSVEASFFKKLSAMENLLYALRLYGRAGGGLRTDIVEILERLGLDRSRVNQPLEQLSRGMQQKVAIARAFLTSPVLLLLDEPTTGLDPRSKRDVQEFILQLRNEHDATIILCTHDMAEAERLCDRIAVIDSGRLIAVDDAEGLKRRAAAIAGMPVDTLEEAFFHLTGRDLHEDEAPSEVD